MSTSVANEIFTVFDARRLKSPELKNIDHGVNWLVGLYKNRKPTLRFLKQRSAAVDAMEKDVRPLSSSAFREEVQKLRDLARVGRLEEKRWISRDTSLLDRAFALAREAAWRAVGKRPYPVQIMGAMGMYDGNIIEMATGEGKTLTAALAASVMAWTGKCVHVITVNDYLVARDAELNKPIYDLMETSVGFVTHETEPGDRVAAYRSGVCYCTSKELVADFLRDQIMMGHLRSSTQTAVSLMAGQAIRARLLVPGLFRAICDEADSLLIDEAVTPLIISNAPNDEPNAERYRRAHKLAGHLQEGRDFKIDKPVKQIDLTERGKDHLDEIATLEDATQGFWAGRRRREELVQQALTALYCFHKDEHYLITDEGKIVIIDEFTGRVMADRSWRHGLHQAIEIKEEQKVTSDKENLARISFQKFFRQYPSMSGMTGTAWESGQEMWQIYRRPVVRIPTNKPCIRKLLPTRMFDTADQKWDAVIERVKQINATGAPILIGTRSVWASETIAERLTAAGLPHRVLNARQDAEEANIVAEAGQMGKITVATNMAGRGTDIILGRGVADVGGLHVIATEPHGSNRVDRQLFGRAGRQGDPGCAQMFCSAEDDLFRRHAAKLRNKWRVMGASRLIAYCQLKAEHLARFNRKQVLRADDWMDQSLPF
jgi:preprotein translocase subunit SecA